MKKIGFTIGIGEKQYSINQVYAKYIANAGFEPIAILPVSNMETMAELCDGLLLPGGKDLNPIYYGDDNRSSINVDPEKDAFERKALHVFKSVKKPIFGICRGFQLMVREYMFHHEEIKQLRYAQGISNHSLASARDVERSIPTHSVVANMSILYGDTSHSEADDKAKIFVNSIHHQALLYQALLSTGGRRGRFASGDDVLEVAAATEFGVDRTATHIIIEGVNIVWDGCRMASCQWHPEELNDIKLIQHFFNEE